MPTGRGDLRPRRQAGGFSVRSAAMPKETARRALSKGWFEHLVRIGHAAKGLVFGALGVIAARLALGDRSETPDFPGALEALSEQPLDVLFLTVLALGLFAYAAWRFAYGLADPDQLDGSARGWLQRAIMFGVGVTYAGFGVYAVGLLLGLRRDEPGLQDEAATIFTLPFGRWIVAAIAAGVIIAGLHELFVAFTARFREEFAHARLRSWERGLVVGVGWWGHASRGAIYCAAGFFGVKSAVRFDPDEARGFSDTLWEISTGPFGDWLLFFVAAGLVCFGIYSLLLALHRHVPDEGDMVPEERVP
jgi:hypothetical protein